MDDPTNMDDSTEEHATATTIRRVALVGAGPVGASLALAWKAARPELAVTGLDSPAALDIAEDAGALDQKAASLEAATAGADLVVLAGRLPAALRQLEALAPHLEPGALVTDTGAVKQPIVQQAADVLPENAAFIGGHPVTAPERAAGKEPDPSRFEGGAYVLCPPAGSEAAGADRLRAQHPDFFALAEATGASVHVVPAERHDRLCATARDLPALLASALDDVAQDAGDREMLHALAGPPFHTLLEHAAPTGGRREELVGNEGAVLDALGRYVRALQQVRRHLAAGDLDAALGAEKRKNG